MESLAQMGVQLLLFTLGLEFSLSKLKAVRSVALAGGMIQITAFMILAGLLATFIGASVHEGVFIGALVRGPHATYPPWCRPRRCCLLFGRLGRRCRLHTQDLHIVCLLLARIVHELRTGLRPRHASSAGSSCWWVSPRFTHDQVASGLLAS